MTTVTTNAVGEVDWTDMFCGAGGSSAGIEQIPGMKVTQALNHWDLAVEAHNANFPDADHDVHDVQEIPVTRFRRTRCLWASPECTHHAYARGAREYDPDAVRSRSTFKDVIRFTEYHRYDAVVVENVIEARLWCDVIGHPEKCSCGGTFDAWFNEMIGLGYEGQVIYFNSQFALPTPQSRDRMYVVFWRKGLKAPNLDFRPHSWCSWCNEIVRAEQTWKRASKGSVRDQDGLFEWGRYGSQYLYCCPKCGKAAAPAVVGARAIIDWQLPTQRIGDRAKPLADKTRERIRAGMERLGKVHPITVQVGGNLFERRPGVRVWSIADPLRTVTGTPGMALVHNEVPDDNQDALIVRYGGQGGTGRGQGEPMQTITAHDREIGLVIPNRAHNVGDQLELPIGAVTTAPAQHMLVQVNRSGDRQAHELDEPTRTIAGHGELAIVTLRRNSDVQKIDQPAPTVTGGGLHHGLLVYNGVPGFVRSIDDAAGTITSRDKQSLLVPYYNTGVAHQLGEPVGTLTGKDRQALVVTEDDVDACHFRMLQWHELLRAQVPHDHADGRPYQLTAIRKDKRGNMRELSNEQRVKMIGNMVSSPVSAMIAVAVGEMLAQAA